MARPPKVLTILERMFTFLKRPKLKTLSEKSLGAVLTKKFLIEGLDTDDDYFNYVARIFIAKVTFTFSSCANP